MRALLVAQVRRRGVITRKEALGLVAEHVLDDALADGVLTRIYPGVYALPDQAAERMLLRKGAIAYRPRTAIAAIDALDMWNCFPFRISATEPVHITGSLEEPPVEWPGLRLHRRSAFVRKSPYAWEVRGLPVVRIEQALVDNWLMLPEMEHRVPAIVALRERKTSGPTLLEVLAANRRAPGSAEMRHVFGLVAAGCHSPLELWGHERVFSHPSLPQSKCQVPMTLSTGNIYLDRYYDEERLDVELDGRGLPRRARPARARHPP